MSRFDSFVAIDLETTGLDSKINEIIELGAVRYDNGLPADRFSMLVRPLSQIPAEITRLTGIAPAMVENAPAIETVVGQYLDFIQDSEWVVGHNVSFDLGFLKIHLENKRFQKLENNSLDTATLCRILFPRFPQYGLSHLLDYFAIKRGRAHRAADDAEATAALYTKLVGHLASLPLPVKLSIGRLLMGARYLEKFQSAISEIEPLFLDEAGLIKFELKSRRAVGESPELYPDNVLGNADIERDADYIPIDKTAVENHFLPGGILSRS